MGSLLVVLIILGCVAYQYLKGTLVKSFIVVITSICASIVAFGYFELLADVLIKNKIFELWAYSLSFALLFILAFAVLQTIAAQLTLKPIDLGLLPERIGRVVFGIFLGLTVSGFLLTAAAMAPISPKYPYQRFDATNPDPEKPGRVLLNADGFATGWFSIVSSGSFSGKRSFATLHPAFLNQLFLNRQKIDNGVSITTSSNNAIEIPNKAVWPAPGGFKNSDGGGVSQKNEKGEELTIVRVGMTEAFTSSQLRVICKQENDVGDVLAGKGKNIYPIGYMKTADEIQMRKLADLIEINKADIVGRTKEIDFAFYVPDGFKPVLVEFKQNCVRQLPPPVLAEQAPPIVPFEKQMEPVKVIGEPNKPEPNSTPPPKVRTPSAQPSPRDANK